MLLLFTKNIAVQDAKKIKTAHDSVLSIQKILDSSPLFSRKISCTDYAIQREYSLGKDLIYLQLNPFSLTRPYSKVENNGFKNSITNSATKSPVMKNLSFQAQVQTRPNNKMRFSFQLGETHGFSNSPNEFNVHEKYTYLSPIILYFSDKKELYKEVYELLLKKREKFIKVGGEDFTNNFISLFSAENPEVELKDFVLPEKYVKQEIIFSGYKEDVSSRGFELCSLYGASFRNELEGTEISNTALYLNKNNQLGIYLTLDDEILAKKMPIISTENINKLIKAPLYKKIIKDNLQDWLKDIIKISAFATDIYNKISVKDLQERL